MVIEQTLPSPMKKFKGYAWLDYFILLPMYQPHRGLDTLNSYSHNRKHLSLLPTTAIQATMNLLTTSAMFMYTSMQCTIHI